MPRSPRLLLSQTCYHIMTRGNNRNNIFRNPPDYEYYLGITKKLKADHQFDLYHYCLMPNHTHFLIKTKKAHDFPTFMKRLNLSYFYYYKKIYKWTGHFFQGRFKSQPIGKDEYFIQCGKYIELNPVRAGIIHNPGDYPYSSYGYYVNGEKNDLITTDFIYEEFKGSQREKQSKYRDLVIDDVTESTYLRNIWGAPNQRYNEARKIRYNLS